MPIITISRGSGSGGRLLAEKLAQKLGFGLVSREDVVHQASEFGVPEEELRTALLKPPGLWSRFGHQRRRYLAFVQAALVERVKDGQVVYHGNAGHLLLPGASNLLCIRLLAPDEFRIRMLGETRGMEAGEAEDEIHRVDKERETWTRFLYGVDLLDPTLYDLTVNLRTLDLDDAVDLAALAASSDRFRPTAESRREMANLVLASRVRAALAGDERTTSAEVEVHAEDGVVALRGRLRPASLLDAVLDVVADVEGVERLDRSDLAAPDFTV
jgi:cytidylate kinase